MSLQISNVDRPEIHFDSGVVEVSAEHGRATLRSADIVQDKNELHFRGTMELPSVIEDFGRTPTTLEITGTAPELQTGNDRNTCTIDWFGSVHRQDRYR